eukprot:80592-Pelagomonas_calceolata.AAC.2
MYQEPGTTSFSSRKPKFVAAHVRRHNAYSVHGSHFDSPGVLDGGCDMLESEACSGNSCFLPSRVQPAVGRARDDPCIYPPGQGAGRAAVGWDLLVWAGEG